MDRRYRLVLTLAAVFLLLGPSDALAVVDMRLANYSDNWIPFHHPLDGERAVEISLTYNSRSLFQGIFGFGWCSDLETRLDLEQREQVIKFKWCGDGGTILFFPAETSGSNQRRYTTQDRFAELLVSGDVLEVRCFTDGCGCSGLVTGARVFRFDREGRLREVLFREGHRHVYSYRLGLLESVSMGAVTVRLEYGSDGRVARLVAPDGRTSEHRYSLRGDQISLKSTWGNKYLFAYDELHNLVRILFPDGTDKRLTYDTERDWLIGFQDRDKCVERYRFEFSRLDPTNHYWALIEKRCGRPEKNTQARFEFWLRPTSRGSKYVYRTRVIQKEEVVDTEHDEHGRRLAETRNGRRTRYRYAEDGSVKEIAAPPAEP